MNDICNGSIKDYMEIAYCICIIITLIVVTLVLIRTVFKDW